jgi:hypothetical protein
LAAETFTDINPTEYRSDATLILTDGEARGLQVSEDARTRITGCTDLDQLEIWVRRAATVGSVEELFD